MSLLLSQTLLQSLSKSEITQLKKYLKSPIFTQKTHLLKLLNELLKTPQEALIVPEKLFKLTFGTTVKHNQHQLNKALSELNGHIEDLLALLHLNKNRVTYLLALLEDAHQREQSNIFNKCSQELLKQPTGDKYGERSTQWWTQFQTRKLRLTYPNQDRMKVDMTDFHQMEEDLDVHYLLNKIQLACNQISRDEILHATDKKNNYKDLLAQVEPLNAKNKSTLLQLYYELLKLFLGQTSLHTLFESLQKNVNHVHKPEIEIIIRFTFNYAIAQTRRGDTNALNLFLQIYDWASTENIWQQSISEDIFLNLGVLFAKTGDTTNFDKLLNAVNIPVHPMRQVDAIQLLRAYFYFYQKDYTKANRSLLTVNTRHLRYSLLRHSMVIRNTYMLFLQKSDNLQGVLDALTKCRDFFARQTKFSQKIKKSYLDLADCIELLSKAQLQPDFSLDALKKEVMKKTPAAAEWVKQMIEILPSTPHNTPESHPEPP